MSPMRLAAYLSIFLMLTLGAFAADLHSHTVRKLRQPPNTASHQQRFSPDNRGTEQAPLIIKTVTPEKSQSDIQKEEEKAELDRKTVQLTGNIVSYTLFLFIDTAILAFASAKASEQHAKTAERALTELPITGDGYQANMFVGWIIGPETRRNEELQTNPPFRVLPLPLAEPLIFHGLLTYSDIFGKRYYCGFAHRINTDGSTQPISRVEAYVRRD